jgi:anaphase-promoting complex subunit 4
MTSLNAMKQIGNKNVGFKVDIVEWSNKMDLIALSNEKGDNLNL